MNSRRVLSGSDDIRKEAYTDDELMMICKSRQFREDEILASLQRLERLNLIKRQNRKGVWVDGEDFFSLAVYVPVALECAGA